MQYLNVKNVAKRYGEKLLFEDVSFIINEGEKVALVAANGTGKSSLIRAMANIEPADAGEIAFAKNINVAFLMQEPDIDTTISILENVLYAQNDTTKAILAYEKALQQPNDTIKLNQAIAKMDASQAWDYETRVKQILFKLNIPDIHASAKNLSGGEKKRVALAKLLVNNPDFLILDEPTNHLDLEMIEWLEEWLIQSKITLLLITHDRYFLENICDRIIELENGLIYSYSGNYSEYLEKKEARVANEQANISKAKNLMRTEIEWMRRMPKARGTKSKARIESFYELKNQANKKIENKEVELEINPERLGSKILELHNISKNYGDKILFKNLNYKFKRFDKLGIIGKNGSGKSTLIKTILGQTQPDTGKVVIGETVKFGVYSQEGMVLKEGMRVIEVVREFGEYIPLKGGGKITAAQLLEKFLFPGYMHYVHVNKLSGGEKRRLYLLTVLIQNPNFLILDEPTNDLDLITLNILEEFLADFPGCLIIVTHDRFFMDKLVEHVFVFGNNGEIADFPGNYTQYRIKENETKETATAPKEQDKNTISTEVEGEKLSYEERKLFNRLEKEIEKLELKKEALHTKMASCVNDYEKLNELSQESKNIEEQIDEKTMEWLELSERA
ncbi:MAG: ABC-F family ATP-binding cassette domain-containing protein [Chitinophagales bacterium]|nr:ABC-F family ATP-binding cassette domain-containing protein [Chitinophagales bacterium]